MDPDKIEVVRILFPAIAIMGAPGSYDAVATLHRDGVVGAVPAIGAVGSVEGQ